MTSVRQLPRLLRIAAVLLRYRLDELVDAAHLFRPLKIIRPFFPKPRADIAVMPRGERLRLALTELGPIFVKFGQILSTRRDLLPPDIAEQLALLQDQVAPFPGAQALAMIEAALGKPIAELYAAFDQKPLASASIAQVHAARLHDGREVVIKVLRPNIAARIQQDIQLLQALGALAQRWHPNADKVRPLDIVAEIENTLRNELDLQREAANASVLRRNFLNSDDMYVPEVFWSHSKESVLTLERVRGIPTDDLRALDAAGIDRIALAEKGVRLFYTQVFRDNFFHADAHPGNIWVDATRTADPRFIALDFGIMGSLPRADQFYLAENFMAMFNRDYRRIAELHVEAGWMPSHIRLDELEAGVRTICEPYFTRPLSEISLGEVTFKLFQMARRYELTLQPQLILLQKTLLNIEGMGRLLHPQIDIWATAKPVLEKILRERYSWRATAKMLRTRIPEWIAGAPEMPGLLHAALKKSVEGQHEVRITSADLRALSDASRANRRSVVPALFGAALLLSAAVLFAFDQHGPRWLGVPLSSEVTMVVALIAFVRARARR
ncbi:ubiquinone biosynthesis regulatory protein kinase UbiB [Pseudolysobacter antarcticus]|uniref:Ubiquinone biosynthesis regulatory protein kinase UbiB n=1 Tax=Pseudolysobacter antarcticus TaxID=2511995 RepID=A0A411HES3_9GAMM|nr:ubiquinone biosynthesis regulatory protein kinase UbiB [Pseudolysobacter antarcticus]QBB68995.1 ubiquinone biosynthesis regulatory protein kinase UbiB [Pseudolysobacter antarcticus]